ncbi:hypothetical protein [Encephalitozoon cuniculi GB-M1]|uniref:Ribosomal RNA-processing protein 42 n=2 Tax=Encephalitozoon cuniculi TaxID=6035 RepID=Q8STZ3_ENCCU|nr:uncharacterized protein ECU11_2040 [Encephalitozoon cuniculi GB-M1]AGE94956.1 hypothetical protein ECU11_2040 [Encephalitozoon cuniculi]KMV65164.1 hypothetical protein M970_112060 [Encephalitozoon cuniculi EcunIII-L]UYI26416.1 exosome complex component [Encephalitozoon cuniculi]CAD26114.1 hypothetical protein [Encephalitozoon cuniculi GB-M1]
MEGFSRDELALVRSEIASGLRADTRKSEEERRTDVVHSNIAQSDGSIKIRRGESEVEVSIQFKETMETLMTQNISGEWLDTNESSMESIEFSKIAIPNIVSSMILELLASYKIGIRIELNILSNDGNVYDLFFIGLSILFKNLDMPVIDDLRRSERRKIDIPTSKTVALFNSGRFVVDPIMIEEKASCGLMHVFVNSNGALMGCLFEGNCSAEQEVLVNIMRKMCV